MSAATPAFDHVALTVPDLGAQGFRADDVDAAHASLVEAGMGSNEAPHRRDFARMYTSYLAQEGGLEVQLVKYDE